MDGLGVLGSILNSLLRRRHSGKTESSGFYRVGAVKGYKASFYWALDCFTSLMRILRGEPHSTDP